MPDEELLELADESNPKRERGDSLRDSLPEDPSLTHRVTSLSDEDTLQSLGIETDTFGSSTGTLTGLDPIG